MHLRSRRKLAFRLVLLALLLSLISSVVALAEVEKPPPSCTFDTLDLPQFDELRDHKVTSSGMLFVADAKTVFVRSPWGWRKVFEMPSGDEEITALGALAQFDDRILVAGSNRLWTLAWSDEIANTDALSTWPRRERRFSHAEVSLPEPIDIAAITSVPDGSSSLGGWLIDRSGGLAPVFLSGSELRVGSKVATRGSNAIARWYPAPNNFGMTFAYATTTLVSLNPDGTEGESFDLKSSINDDAYYPPPSIRTLAVDTERNLLFVGTNYGVLVAERDPVTGKITSPFRKIAALGMSEVLHLDIFLGRLLIIGRAKFDDKAGGSVLAWESAQLEPGKNLTSFADGVSFTRGPDGPSPDNASAAVKVDTDLLWVEGNDGRLWEWSESGWKILRRTDVKFGDSDIDSIHDPLRRPLIVPSQFGERLALCQESEPFWHRIAVTDTSAVADMVPDPQGLGTWVLSHLTPNNPREC